MKECTESADNNGVSRAHFTVTFDGPAVEQGEIDAGDLGHSLVALAYVFRTANAALSGHDRRVELLVRAGTHPGSFKIELDLVTSMVTEWLSTLREEGNKESAKWLLHALAGGATASLLWLLKWLRGTKPTSVEKIEGSLPPMVRVTVMHEEETRVTEIPESVLILARDPKVRQAVAELVSPLHEDRIASLKIAASEQDHSVISAEDSIYYRAEAAAPDLPVPAPQEIEVNLRIVAPSFQRGNKWRVEFGDQRISAEMADESFWDRVQQGEQFGSGDFLVAQLEISQKATSKGYPVTYTVRRVLRHVKAPRQTGFDFGTDL